MIDRTYCMSSYLMYRSIANLAKAFFQADAPDSGYCLWTKGGTDSDDVITVLRVEESGCI